MHGQDLLGQIRRAGRSCHACSSAPALACSAVAAAWQVAATRPWRASCSRITRITSRCAVTVAPSTLKVSSEDPASRATAASTTSAATPSAAGPPPPGLPGLVEQRAGHPGRR